MQTRHRAASFETHTMRSSTSGTSAAFGQFPALVTEGSPHLAPTIFRHPGGRSETPDIFQKGCCDRTAAKAIGRRSW